MVELRPRPPRAGSRPAPRAPPRAAPPWARGCPRRAGSRTRAGAAPREGGVGVALRPGEDLDGHRCAAKPDGRLGGRPAQAGAPRRHVAHRGRGQHRRHEVRAAAVVLLVCLRGVLALLVAGDRLVLDAVVGGQVAAAQRQQRRRHAEQRHRRLAADRARAARADRVTAGGRGAHGAERAHVLHRQLGVRQRPLYERDDRDRLRQLHHSAQARQPFRGAAAEVGLAVRRDLQLALAGAYGGGPVCGPVHEQPVAQRHAAQPQLVLGDVHTSSSCTRCE